MGLVRRALAAAALVCLAATSAARPTGSTPVGPPVAAAGPAAATSEPGGARSVLGRVAPSPGAPAPQVAEGLRFEHHARWDVDPTVPTVRVRHELRLTNTAPDEAVPGGIRYTYFPEVVLPVPAGASALAATGPGGRTLPTRLDASESPFVAVAVVDLVPDLRYGDTQDVVVTYELPSTGPRSTSPVRVNPAYVGFPLLVIGDPDATTIEIRVPDPFDVEVVGAELDERRDGDATVLSGVLTDPDAWFASIVARNDDALLSTEVDVGEHGVVVRAWPDDPAWAEFAVGVVTDGVPVLEERIGLPWPADRTIEVLETAAPYEYGYAGWYQPLAGVIEVGDELDGQVVLHELAHLWFNDALFRQRWINEGLAEVFAHAVAADLGLDPGERPGAPEPIRPAAPGALPLNDWSSPVLTEEVSTDQEAFGYNAAWAVMEALRREVGLEGLAEVVGAAARREPAYAGPGFDEVDGTFGWTHLLDLLEDRVGSAAAAGLFAAHVVTDDERASLEERAEARSRYEALEARSEPWATPAALRRTMTAWRFREAEPLLQDAAAVLDVRDEAEPVLARAGVELDDLRAGYEGDEPLSTVVAEAERARAAVGALAEALDAEDRAVGLLGRVGLLLASPSEEVDAAAEALAAGDYDAAIRRAERAVALVEGADRAGAMRLGGVAVVFLAAGALGWWAARRRAVAVAAADGATSASGEVRDPGR